MLKARACKVPLTSQPGLRLTDWTQPEDGSGLSSPTTLFGWQIIYALRLWISNRFTSFGTATIFTHWLLKARPQYVVQRRYSVPTPPNESRCRTLGYNCGEKGMNDRLENQDASTSVGRLVGSGNQPKQIAGANRDILFLFLTGAYGFSLTFPIETILSLFRPVVPLSRLPFPLHQNSEPSRLCSSCLVWSLSTVFRTSAKKPPKDQKNQGMPCLPCIG